MKRFHVHLHVADLSQSVGFYSRMFGQQPARVEADYAKWMLDDPPVNFAVSTRGQTLGVDHLGIQADNAEDLAALKERALQADSGVLLDEGVGTCCYARSDKHWITDPQGIAWEHFQTLDSIPVFREAPPAGQDGPADALACCPPRSGTVVGTAVKSAGPSCC